MDSGKRKMVVIGLIGVLIIAAAAVVLMGGGSKEAQGATVADASGTNVKVNASHEKIVSCSPAVTEMVCELGLTDNLVAVTKYDDYPAKAVALVKANKTVGGFKNPSFESILNYTPDMVFLEAGAPGHDDLAKQLRNSGYNVVVMYPQENLVDVYKCIELIGQVTAKQTEANALIAHMKGQIAEISSVVQNETKPNVMFVVYADQGFQNVYVAGGNTAIDQIVTLAGGKNVFANVDGFQIASSEELDAKAASVDYIVMTVMYSDWQPADIAAWFKADSLWKVSPAVENNKVYFLWQQAESIFNRQSVRTVDAVQLMAEILHPANFTTTVPFNATGLNLLGDEYVDYLPAESTISSQAASVTMVAVIKD